MIGEVLAARRQEAFGRASAVALAGACAQSSITCDHRTARHSQSRADRIAATGLFAHSAGARTTDGAVHASCAPLRYGMPSANLPAN